MDNKHAYCIMAHSDWSQLQKLINSIDDKRCDIFLHIDAKVYNEFHNQGGAKVLFSQLYEVEFPVDVRWSDVTLADAEVSLFNKVISTGNNYSYIHLISGVDMPLINKKRLYSFFEGRDEEFLELDFNKNFRKRLKYYHYFVKRRRHNVFYDNLRRLLLLPQLLFVDRLQKCPLIYAHGPEWCSITMDAVYEIAQSYKQYRYIFEKTTCADTHYKQMILYSSDKHFRFAKEGNLRFVIFDEPAPSPRTLSMHEYEQMMASGALFARKFEEHTDVFEKIYKQINKLE